MKYGLMTWLALTFFACAQPKQESVATKPQPTPSPAKTATLSPEDSAKRFELGDDLVSTSKQVISAALVGALEKGGVQYAAQFCNVAAHPILDSLSKASGATIRRVSDKPRNPKDAMDDEERAVFAIFKAKAQQPDAEIPPIVMRSNDSTISFYKPIKISMPTCLKCHGEVGKDVKTEDYAILKRLYPNDEAIGYKQGDLRGMFSIRFVKTHSTTQ